MNYQVGDTVRIRDNLEVVAKGISIIDDINDYRGKVGIIENIELNNCAENGYVYSLDIDGQIYKCEDWMFEKEHMDTCVFLQYYYYATITFENSSKEYIYKISKTIYDDLKKLSQEFQPLKLKIVNSNGWDYRNATVTVVKLYAGCNEKPIATKTIQYYEVVNDTITKETKHSKKKGKTIMKLFDNFEFGKLNTENVKYSIKGIAYRTPDGPYCNKFVAWDADKEDLVDVTELTFDIGDFLYKMPVAVTQIAVGDIIVHNSKPVFVCSIDNSKIEVMSPVDKEIKTILPVKNIFGFNFVTKIVDITNGLFNGKDATDDNPFGNILPFLLMKDSDNDTSKLLPFILLCQNGGQFDQNTLMMLALTQSGDTNDLLPLMFLGGQNPFAPQDFKVGKSNDKYTKD